MSKTKQWCLYGLAIILVVGLIFTFKPEVVIKPTGIVLPLAKPRTPHATQSVQLLTNPPANYQALALINIELHSLKPSKGQLGQIEKYAIALAAKQGANGLVVNAFGFEPPSANNPTPLAKYVFRGEAIYFTS